jgi:REP element-mobilizing transposase RayT
MAAYDYDREVSEIEVVDDHIHMMLKAEPREIPSHIRQVILHFTSKCKKQDLPPF